MSVGIIFDLDQTLIDSRLAKPHRDKREWAKVYGLIPKLVPYSGMDELIALLNGRGVPVAIVTSSPRSYYAKVIAHHRFAVEKSVCYHDAPKPKPHPAPILKGIELLGLPAGSVWSIGDEPRDVEAAHAAGAHSVAVTWGTADRDSLIASGAEQTFDTVQELHDFLDRLTSRKG